MQTSGAAAAAAAESTQEDLKSGRRRLKERLSFILRSKFLPSCPGQEPSERKPYYWMPVSQVHSLSVPKGTSSNKLWRSFPIFNSHNFLKKKKNFTKVYCGFCPPSAKQRCVSYCPCTKKKLSFWKVCQFYIDVKIKSSFCTLYIQEAGLLYFRLRLESSANFKDL